MSECAVRWWSSPMFVACSCANARSHIPRSNPGALLCPPDPPNMHKSPIYPSRSWQNTSDLIARHQLGESSRDINLFCHPSLNNPLSLHCSSSSHRLHPESSTWLALLKFPREREYQESFGAHYKQNMGSRTEWKIPDDTRSYPYS